MRRGEGLDQRERKGGGPFGILSRSIEGAGVDCVPGVRTGTCMCSSRFVGPWFSGQLTLPGHGLRKGGTHPRCSVNWYHSARPTLYAVLDTECPT